jgi:cytochrome b561
MYSGLLHAHSGLRYIVLLLLVLAIFRAVVSLKNKTPFGKGHKMLYMFAMVSTHIQLVIGLLLYLISPVIEVAMSDMGMAMKDKVLRFWAVEHFSMMLIAIVLITAGYSLSKRSKEDSQKHKRVLIFYSIGLLLILASIPWPFSQVARGWF